MDRDHREVLRSPTILCIDDEALGLQIRKAVLEHAGYLVLTALDGETGMILFTQNDIDAVILDYYMPGMDGGQVARAMREKDSGVPILMLSAYVDLPKEITDLADVTMLKGEGPEALIARIGELIAKTARDRKGDPS
jgi:DNA-binding response OmpR family regulator